MRLSVKLRALNVKLRSEASNCALSPSKGARAAALSRAKPA